MTCRTPLRQYHAESGWSFNPAKPHTESRDIDCGVCIDCRIRKSRDWAIRAYHEQAMHKRSCFVTLTYAENPVTLRRLDVQLFFKSLRNAGFKFSYFGCGEYGDKTLRPHYHIILFGIDFAADRYPWRKTEKGFIQYRSATLEKHWPHGNAEIGEATEQSAAYVARYTLKKINGDFANEADIETGLRPYDRILPDERVMEVAKEMLFVSLRPAIGLRWFLKYGAEVYPADTVVMNGKEYKPPKYYDTLLKKYRPDIWEEVINARLEHVEILSDERRKQICDSREANRRAKNVHKRDGI